jgi:hypothetical protein
MSDIENISRASQVEELRLAKQQQWLIAIAAATLLAAIFWIEWNTKLDCSEKTAATVFIALTAASGVLILFKLQDYMKRARLALNPQDPTPWLRGADVLCLLASVTLLAAFVVLYFLWATHAASKSC